MDRLVPPWTLGQLAQAFGAELKGPADLVLQRPTNCSTGDPQGISFAEKRDFVREAEENGVGALIIGSKLATDLPHLVVENPRAVFGQLLHWTYLPLEFEPGIHPTAVVHPTATVSEKANLGPYTVVGARSTVGAGSVIHPFVSIGDDCTVGENCVLFPHAVLVASVRLGDRVVIHSGSVLGADGFGYYWDGAKRQKVPQIGRVELSDDVEVGALSAIDRATAGATSIGKGTKIDNICQIAHNVRIGEHTVIAARAGIAGSAKVGNRVEMAGAVDMNTHVSVPDDTVLAGRTGVASSIHEPGVYFGLPAMPFRHAQRVLMLNTKLPELFERLTELEREVQELKKNDPTNN